MATNDATWCFTSSELKLSRIQRKDAKMQWCKEDKKNRCFAVPFNGHTLMILKSLVIVTNQDFPLRDFVAPLRLGVE